MNKNPPKLKIFSGMKKEVEKQFNQWTEEIPGMVLHAVEADVEATYTETFTYVIIVLYSSGVEK